MDNFSVYNNYFHKCLVSFVFVLKRYIETNIVLS